MGLYCLHAALVAGVPDAKGLVVARRQDKLTARMENNTSHPVIVSDQREQAKSCTDVPHLHNTMSASQNQKNNSFFVKNYNIMDIS